ncbi:MULTISPECIES: FecR domain-containing protein [unclassified Sphingomonas]|jgi:transmembrane sensor|uniref:FecR family protein n=2 Tax=Pseudomonadota TaxID=1224 RepID=UPI0010F4AEC2|nr:MULTISPECIES: FecR domain-containing protein [unclassified Sphingomonas]
MSERNLGKRAPAVFDAFLDGRDADLHPADRAEASAFWNWLGEFERPGAAPVRQRPAWLGRAAAGIAALAVVGGTFWLSHPRTARETVQSVATGHAERRRIAFSDGSVVTLAADSRVDVAYAPRERRLRLVAGEALFKVAHDKSRPFVVETRHGEVVAVGTMFDVSVGKGEAKVTVVEGVVRVALSEPGRRGSAEPIEKLAHKGERLSFGIAKGMGGDTGFIRQAADIDADSAVAWTRGRLVFRGEPLSEVIEEVNRYAKDRLILTDPRAGSVRVYGVVNQGDTAAIRDLIANPGAVAIESRQR